MRLKPLAWIPLLCFALVLFTGCGGGDEGGDAMDDTPAADTPAAGTAPMGSASITGTINFTGEAPERPRLQLDRDCRNVREDDAVLAQNVVVNDGGTLRYVFVYVKEGLPEGTYATPSEPVVLDQEGCMYEPHVFGVQTGQTIRILNSDPFQHNIHAIPEENRGFNQSTPNEGDEITQSFRVPEVMVRIKCDVHGWMLAYAGVLEHPYFDTTGDDGTFTIEGLPAGTYTVETWHETFGTQTQQVTVGDGEAATADFTYAASA